MCTKKGPFHLAVHTHGMTIEEVISFVIRSHTPDYNISVAGDILTIARPEKSENTTIQLPEHIAKRIGELIAKLPPHESKTRLRAHDANFPAINEAFAYAWGARGKTLMTNVKMMSIRHLAIAIGLVERDGIPFDQAYKRCHDSKYAQILRDH